MKLEKARRRTYSLFDKILLLGAVVRVDVFRVMQELAVTFKQNYFR